MFAGKKKCLYCEVEEDGEETSLVDVSEETVTVGDKEVRPDEWKIRGST